MRAQGQLLSEFEDLRSSNPTIRAIDAASRLGVSEGALVETRAATKQVTRLAPQGAGFAELIAAMPSVGRVMTLTRNPAAVHETKGVFGDADFHGAMGQVTGQIDLRLFTQDWYAGYHITEETKSGVRYSIQIFSGGGTAILKIFATDETDARAWSLIVDRFSGGGPVEFEAPPPARADLPDDEIDLVELRSRWRKLEHSHGFFGMLRDLNVGRQQALRLAGGDLARPIDPAAAHVLLDGASAAHIPIMCFVGNTGAIQIFSGLIDRVVMMGAWLNVLDADFNLHLRTDMVRTAWVVTKPTSMRGQITSVELFDSDGEMVCQFFGQRSPGECEHPKWRELVQRLPLSGTV